MPGATHLCDDIDNQIDALGGGEKKSPVNLLWLTQRHAVQGNNPAVEPVQPQLKHPCIGSVDQSQPQPVVPRHVARQVIAPIRGDVVPEPACMTEIMHGPEGVRNLCGLGIDQPIIEDKDLLMIDVERVLVPTPAPGDATMAATKVRPSVRPSEAREHICIVRGKRPTGAFSDPSNLPPCSPDLNPIEQAFTKLRH